MGKQRLGHERKRGAGPHLDKKKEMKLHGDDWELVDETGEIVYSGERPLTYQRLSEITDYITKERRARGSPQGEQS